MSLSYAFEKLSVAISSMAKDTNSLQERLRGAYLIFHPLRAEDFPRDLSNQYREIEKSLTKVPAVGDEGTVMATTRAMSDEEAAKLIESIVDLFTEVAERYGATQD